MPRVNPSDEIDTVAYAVSFMKAAKRLAEGKEEWEDNHSLIVPFYMLIGFSLENALKAILEFNGSDPDRHVLVAPRVLLGRTMLGDEVRQTASSGLQKCSLMFRKPRFEQQRNDCDSDLFANVVVVLDPIRKISGGLADIATGRLGHGVIKVRKFHFGSLFLAVERARRLVAIKADLTRPNRTA